MEPKTDAIWVHFSSDLKRFLRRRVEDDSIADDLLQETFVRVHRNIDGLQDAQRLAGWVYQIARNVVADHHRRSRNTPVEQAKLDLLSDDLSIDERGDEKSVCLGVLWLNDMVQALPDGYREAVHLSEIDGRSQQEVADQFDLSLSGAKSRIQGKGHAQRHVDAMLFVGV
ncbi:MAG: sigma-70 family RNA polymerase sigma factor [Pirellulales bacterium]